VRVLTHPEIGVIADPSEVDAVGHRMVHGGEHFTASALATPEAIRAVQDCVSLAPIVPVENAIEGGVNATVDALIHDAPDVVVRAEELLPVSHALIGHPDIALAAEPDQPRNVLQMGVEVAGLKGHDHHAVRLHVGDQLRLGGRHRLDRAEQLDVNRTDVRDHADVRFGDHRQLGDLAFAPHRHFQDQGFRSGRRLEDGQGQADLGIEVFRRGVNGAGQERPGYVLDRGLADRAGDGDDLALHAGAAGTAKRLECGQDIGHDQQRRILGNALGDAADQPGAAALQRLGDEIVAVEGRALQRHEQIARHQLAGVGADRAETDIRTLQPARARCTAITQFEAADHATRYLCSAASTIAWSLQGWR